ncbi:MAG: hypothetical protein DMF79_11125 [Acidobacteria bacterium]|nr:MAG: hypothetical protein DMF79_11125 [Acidobacteriota bacterium]
MARAIKPSFASSSARPMKTGTASAGRPSWTSRSASCRRWFTVTPGRVSCCLKTWRARVYLFLAMSSRTSSRGRPRLNGLAPFPGGWREVTALRSARSSGPSVGQQIPQGGKQPALGGEDRLQALGEGDRGVEGAEARHRRIEPLEGVLADGGRHLPPEAAGERGLVEEFGKARVRNTPIIESGAVGAAMGLALAGFVPMVEMQFGDFITCAFNQIVNNLAKTHFRWGGRLPGPGCRPRRRPGAGPWRRREWRGPAP